MRTQESEREGGGEVRLSYMLLLSFLLASHLNIAGKRNTHFDLSGSHSFDDGVGEQKVLLIAVYDQRL